MASHSTLSIRNLTFAYHESGAVFKNAQFDFASGRVNYIVGASGSGKTTLAFILVGELTPASGEFDAELRDVSLVLQFPEQMFLEQLVADEISSLGDLQAQGFARGKLMQFGFDVEAIQNLPPDALSFGQRRMLAIILQSARKCPTLVLDEPTLGLDETNLNHVIALIESESVTRKTCIVITHDLDLITSSPGQVIIIDNASAVWNGDSREFLARDDLMRLAHAI